MLAFRLSVFSFACLAFFGYEWYLGAFALVLAALTMYAVAKSRGMLLTYCHVAAAAMWAASAMGFLLSGGPVFLIVAVSLMIVLDGFFKP
jgi:L-cysteine desulfidase